MNKAKRCLLLVVVIMTYWPEQAHAQFLNLRLDIDEKVSASTEQTLDFGSLLPNSGRREIAFGDDMGLFVITALEEKALMVAMDIPDRLNHEDDQVADHVPLNLQVRYGFDRQDYNSTFPLPQTMSSITIRPVEGTGPWHSVYFFLIGSIFIEDISSGTYTNDVMLYIEYL